MNIWKILNNDPEIEGKIRLNTVDERIHAYLAISVLFGLRRGETVGLKWENVILESSETYPHGYLIVRATATNDFGNGEKVTINNTTKTGKIRAIAIFEKNLIFRHIKEKEAENKKIAGNAWHAEWDGFVCRDELGDLATPDYISSAWTNYRDHYLSAKNSAYKNVRFHDLRHTAATIIYETTADMQLVQKILGHSTITTTVNLKYGHIIQSSYISIQKTMPFRSEGLRNFDKDNRQSERIHEISRKNNSPDADNEHRGCCYMIL